MKQTLTILLASIMLMACYRNKKQPEDYLYKQGTSNHIYFQKEEGKTIYCTLKKGSSISFDCQNNGYTYVYSPDSNLTYSGKMPFIPADTSYIEFYGKRFYPRKAKQKSLYIQKISKKLLPLDEPGNVISDSNFWGRMITTPGKAELLNTNLINRVRGIPQPSPVPDTLPDSLASSRQYREWIRKDTIPKPQYEYVYKTTIPINQLQPTLDTINMIMENFGIDMMGSRSKALKELFNQKMGVLLRGLAIDSIKIVGGGGR